MGRLYTKMATVNVCYTCAMWTYDVIENTLSPFSIHIPDVLRSFSKSNRILRNCLAFSNGPVCKVTSISFTVHSNFCIQRYIMNIIVLQTYKICALYTTPACIAMHACTSYQDIILQAGGSLRSPPAAPNSPLLPSHSYIPAHMHAIRCCKQGCERADLAHMKSSKERVKGTDHVNSMRLILQLWCMRIYFILFEARDLSNQQAKKLVSLLALSLARPVKARSQKLNHLRDNGPDNIFS